MHRRGCVAVLALWAAVGVGLGAPRAAPGQEAPPPPAPEPEQSAAECCLVLLLPVGARAIASGRTLVAVVSPDAVFANPAGLAGLRSGHLVLHRTNIAADATALSVVVTTERVGTFGLSYELLDFGEIENTDEQGRTVGSITLRHHILVASYATSVVGGLAAGMNYKLYQFHIGCRGQCDDDVAISATTHAVDLGIRYQPEPFPAVQLGIVVTNIGFPLQVVNAQQADPLPVRIRLGARYEVLHHFRAEDGLRLWVAAEVEERWREAGDPTPSVGIELSARDVVFLRTGFVPGDGVGTGVAVGLGVHYARFTVAVAKSFMTGLVDATEPVQVSLGMSF
ncbi:MAG TPA: PorV/PorQ family protein [Longimicrobiales bacterium]